jgi:predicted small secreted protein
MTYLTKLRPLIAITLLAALAACGTVEGFGRDISSASNRASQLF